MRHILLASAMLAVTACAATPAPSGGGGGGAAAYKEEQLSANRYRVSYTSPGEATKGQIADRTLARAAQITLDKGHEWFEVASTIDGDKSQTLVIEMGSGETLAGGANRQYDARETLDRLRNRIG
jgi:hypothetical protein